MLPLLYTMDGCPHCVRAKNALDANNVQYQIEVVNDRKDRNYLYYRWANKLKMAAPKDQRTFPKMLVYVGDEEIILPNADEIILYAKSGI